MKRVKSFVLALSFIICSLSCLSSCGGEKCCSSNFFSMDTLVSTKLYCDKETGDRLNKEIEEKCLYMQSLFDTNTDSEISRLNSRGRAELSGDSVRVLKEALKMGRETNGAFDITVFPLLKLWGFNNGEYGVPKDDKIKEALKFVGYKNVSLDGSEALLPENYGISLGGIAKGYTGDVILEMLKKEGVSGVVSLGGNIVLCGDSPNGKWTVGVRDPEDESKLICEVKLDGNRSVVTSGAYERYFEYNGKKYHHIIDPSTGKPAETDILSVTVIGENGTECDALSTALFVFGYEKAVDFSKKTNSFGFIIIKNDRSVYVSDNIKDSISL